jgi:putative glutamine amidotransferase
MPSHKPRIGVSWVPADEAETHLLVRAVRDAGGEPVPLLATQPVWTAQVHSLRGLILSGGNAVDPRRYGQVNEGLCRTVIPERDALEFDAFQLCRAHDLPILGVCRGHQFVNVSCGGSMLQDLTITTVQHEAAGDPSVFHAVTIMPDTRLAGIAGAGQLRVNSRHHQGLRAEHVAPGLRVAAVAADGVVEGVEATDGRFLVGIQFHPERPDEVPEMVGIFRLLIEAAG